MAKRTKSRQRPKIPLSDKPQRGHLNLADRLDNVALELTVISDAVLGCEMDRKRQSGFCHILDRQIEELRAIGKEVQGRSV